MRALRIGARLSLAALVALAGAAAAADVQVSGTPEIVPREAMSRYVSVRDVRSDDGTVSGTVANTSNNTIRDVQLIVRHEWLWNNEFHPGVDNYSHVETYTVPGEIPPGGSKPFTVRSESPQPGRADGHFATDVQVGNLTAISGGSMGSSGSATSRVGAPEGGTTAQPLER